ncbi:probable sarcosine oxidase [Acanthaster planci]|uniref:Probable sarcosine oxidase n=1 Tax=Acanthaster planci TaxID=133434 RepID=A0A8B7ZKQ3_ACAPL|nr:probable sarcosine oxidase [Acanthaster planci]XP_022106210.1 probable sarcosine oxidase [Acanthaster planci]XP_022106211.1 probable sarcosine oxidase [Acanthaster planci]
MAAADEFDVCIVGAGLWGSAAAKYCSARLGNSVCLIGPSEPTTKQDYDSRFVFGAHYDEGRAVGAISSTFEWGELARRSAGNFSNIEQETGIHFYSNVGSMWLTAQESSLSQKLLDVANQTGIHATVLDQEKLHQSYNFLSTESIPLQKNTEIVGIIEKSGAGYLSPRKLVRAQQMLAHRQGCKIVDDIVNRLSCHDSQHSFDLITEGGKIIHAKKVLLCAGASLALEDFLPGGLQLDLALKTQLVVLMEIAQKDRDRLLDMPSLHVHEGEKDLGLDCYILPPIQYPDGQWYLKIGHGKVGEEEVTSKEQLKAWYCGCGDASTSDRLTQRLQDLFPGLNPISLHTVTCVTACTPTGHLYCDMVAPGLGVLVGGNGYGAKSSDEIGHMGANMILKGEWDYDMPKDKFAVQLKSPEFTISPLKPQQK